MMRILAALAAVWVSGCSRTEDCTEKPCSSRFRISVQQGDSPLPPDTSAQLRVDGRVISCVGPFQANKASPCGSDVTIESRELLDCRPTAAPGGVAEQCVPTGRFEQIISIAGTPSRVDVSLTSSDAVIGERVFHPKYELVTPNGPQCEPRCMQSEETWTLPP